MILLSVGFDDHDSPGGGCTTDFTIKTLFSLIKEVNAWPIDYPYLVRLNPSIPWKTRGNGATCIHVIIPENYIEKAIDIIEDLSLSYTGSAPPRNSSPGAVALLTPTKPDTRLLLHEFYKRCVSDVVTLDEAYKLAHKVRARIIRHGRGLIGALAAIGWIPVRYTYELLTYRDIEDKSRDRIVDRKSVEMFARVAAPFSFNNFDFESSSPLISPHGPDPVVYGVRSTHKHLALLSIKFIKARYKTFMLFKTNQATDDHALHTSPTAKPFKYVRVKGIIEAKPQVLEGGHIILRIRSRSTSLEVAIYSQLGSSILSVVRRLKPGDEVEIHGPVKPYNSSFSINVEKLSILSVKPHESNPLCPRCGSRLKSLGRNKGMKCKKCGFRTPYSQKIEIPRTDLPIGVPLTGKPSSHSHLLMPLQIAHIVGYKQAGE